MNSISQLIERVRNGDDQAATDLWNRYYGDLISLARRKLGNTPRTLADEDDVVAQAFASLCRRAEQGQFPDLQDRDDLWKLLFRIAERKAYNQIRHAFRKKNLAINDSKLVDEDGEGGLDTMQSNSPSPEFAIVIADEVAWLLGQLDDPMERNICIKKMEGLTNQGIADSLNCSLWMVEDRLRRIRSSLVAKGK